jgi:uncharacterized protein YbjT (DUF2867 family)
MILVTGAGGKTGQAVIKALSKNNRKIRAFIHNAAKTEYIKSLGASEIMVGDLLDEEAVNRATKDVRAIYHICPNVHPNEIEIGHLMLDVARKNGAEHFVFHSVLHPQIEAMPHHWQKMQVEEKIFASGLAFTILQPTMYMQNILGYLDPIKRDGVYLRALRI